MKAQGKVYLLTALLALNVTGSGNPDDKIIGKWEIDKVYYDNKYKERETDDYKKKKIGVEFFKDKTYHS
jgi:hypothetical protein